MPVPRATVAVMFFINFLCISTVTQVLCQDCVESGRWCMDDKACCGGCCRNNACIDMYGSCLVYDDLCLNHYCPPGLVCCTYQPDCKGCSSMPDCKKSCLD